MSLEKQNIAQRNSRLAVALAAFLLAQPGNSAHADIMSGTMSTVDEFNPYLLQQVTQKIILEAGKLRKGREKEIKFIDMKAVIPVEHPDKQKFKNWHEALLQSGRIHNQSPNLPHIKLCKDYKGNTGKDCESIKDASALMRITEYLRQAAFIYAQNVCLKYNENVNKARENDIKRAIKDAKESTNNEEDYKATKEAMEESGGLIYILRKYKVPAQFDNLAIVFNLKYGSKFQKTGKLNYRLSNVIVSCHHRNTLLRGVQWLSTPDFTLLYESGWDAFKFNSSLKAVLNAKKK